ncbi:MAG TPA: class I SAM-dependent methyltransferase [Steroidobacteraceae bacterium]|jgi:trans-aconitate methyltransferase
MAQTWNSELYEKNARFVSDLGAPVLTLLDPQAGERILDLGCGDGVLTKKIADMGCEVVGVDSSPDFVASARKRGLTVLEQSAYDMNFSASFDAVFSNAALHWMKDADRVIERVAAALRPQGRFVAEFGGHNCVDTVLTALIAELDLRGYSGQSANPWYFPSVEEYGSRLTAAGFDVPYIALIPRPTPLPGDIMGWLATFAGSFTSILPVHERIEYLECVRNRIKPRLCDSKGNWTADYVRLRFVAQIRI